jgi:hypothetical protein
MKIIPKIILLILLNSLSWLVVNGQQANEIGKLGITVQTSIGMTSPNSPFGYALGIGFGVNASLSEELALGLSVGYSRLLTKDTSPIKDYDFIPLKAWLKIFPTPTSFYATGLTGTGIGIQSGSKPSFIFGGGFGYQWDKSFDLALHFEGYHQQKSSSSYHPFNGQFAIEFSYGL